MMHRTTWWTALVAACWLGGSAAAEEPTTGESDPDKPTSRPIEPSGPSDPGTGTKTPPDPDAVRVLGEYPEAAQAVGMALLDEYGPPIAANKEAILWRGNGPWKRTVLHRGATRHDFPRPHEDFLEQVVSYRVPVDMFDDLARYDGSIVVDRTRGEMSVHCDSEAMNYLTLNLANDVVTGQKTVDQARRYHAQTAAAYAQGQRDDPYVTGLRFTSAGNTADPDNKLAPSM